jgi:hypothetical protein
MEFWLVCSHQWLEVVQVPLVFLWFGVLTLAKAYFKLLVMLPVVGIVPTKDFLSAFGRFETWAALCGLLAMALAEFCISWSSKCRRVGACTVRCEG